MTIGDLIVGVDDIKLSIKKILERIDDLEHNDGFGNLVRRDKVKEIIKSEMGELGIK